MTNTAEASTEVDVRGPRFAGWVTTVALVVARVVSAFSPTRAKT